MNLTGLSGLVQKGKFLVNDNAPTILTGVGVAGTVVTAVLTGRASFKAADLIAQAQNHRMHPLTANLKESETEYVQYGRAGYVLSKTEKIKEVWPLYIPPVTTGALTVAAIVMANRISGARLAALTTAAALSERRFQEYRDKITEKFSTKQEREIRDEIATDRVLKNPKDTREVIIAGTGDVLCYDMLTGRYFMSSAEKIRKAENRINHELNNFMHASLTEFYEEVGLPPTTYTDMVGWNGNDNLEVQITAVKSDDEKPCLAIDFTPPPHSEYRKNLYD